MAASSTSSEDGGLIADINVTPLVDITLVLLIIMMVVAPVLARNDIMGMELPQAKSGTKDPESNVLRISVTLGKDRKPVVYLNDALIQDEASARALIHQQAAKDPKPNGRVSGDLQASYGDVIHWLDILRLEGINAAIEVKPDSPAP